MHRLVIPVVYHNIETVLSKNRRHKLNNIKGVDFFKKEARC